MRINPKIMKKETLSLFSITVMTLIYAIELLSNSAARSQISSRKYTSPSWIAQNVNCEDTNNVTEANQCLSAADSELNQAYQQVIKGVSGEERQKLITAEKAWIKYRDTNCAFRTHNFPLSTSMGRQFYFVCQTRLTRERTMELRR